MSEFRRRLLMQSKSLLPSAYQQVEYIESQQSQAITLDYIVQEDDVIDFTFYILKGAREVHLTQASNGVTGIWYNYTTAVYIRFGGNTSIVIGSTPFYRVKNVKLKKGEINDNGKITPLPFVYMPNRPQSIFAGLRPDGVTYFSFSIARIYAYSIYNDSETKINLIPCYRKSDGEIGLYDTINKKFYTNLGTGEFLKGADV